MGRPPCCDKVGVKKGPWTPEEDIMLVSYVQQHGPANWRAVPTNTGLKRCSKSCRLRWTNYLRPGIKRGTFTDNEEKMIIQLQALLGNKWAAIASYLPERTDNDIKNYWNTHLQKKLRKLETKHTPHSISRGQWEKRLQTDIHTAKQALQDALSVEEEKSTFSDFSMPNYPQNHVQTSPYASSTENIARLLQGWVKKTPKSEDSTSSNYDNALMESSCSVKSTDDDERRSKSGVNLSEAFESLFGFESSNSDDFSRSTSPSETKPDPIGLGLLENWLLDDQGREDYFSFDENLNLF